MKLVKLPPYSKRHRFLLRRVVILNPRMIRFIAERGWYRVEDDVAEAVAELHQIDGDPMSPKAFLIAKDEEEAKQIDARIAKLLRPKEEDSVGTADAPISAERPGRKKTQEQEAEEAAASKNITSGRRTRKKRAAKS